MYLTIKSQLNWKLIRVRFKSLETFINQSIFYLEQEQVDPTLNTPSKTTARIDQATKNAVKSHLRRKKIFVVKDLILYIYDI